MGSTSRHHFARLFLKTLVEDPSGGAGWQELFVSVLFMRDGKKSFRGTEDSFVIVEKVPPVVFSVFIAAEADRR